MDDSFQKCVDASMPAKLPVCNGIVVCYVAGVLRRSPALASTHTHTNTSALGKTDGLRGPCRFPTGTFAPHALADGREHVYTRSGSKHEGCHMRRTESATARASEAVCSTRARVWAAGRLARGTRGRSGPSSASARRSTLALPWARTATSIAPPSRHRARPLSLRGLRDARTPRPRLASIALPHDRVPRPRGRRVTRAEVCAADRSV